MTYKCDRSIIIWLIVVCIMIFAMVIIGGITRLTDSGLSMVEWRPLLGTLPPLNEVEWNRVFELYKQYPEYQIINEGMTMSEFKFIFFWEWFHRLFGRLIGMVFFLPYFYFLIKKKIPSHLKTKLFVAFVLGGLQGLMGWYMVKSGLVDRPDVSHFRLAAHFGLALTIIGYISWIIFDQVEYKKGELGHYPTVFKLLFGLTIILSVQIVYGAFVAGLDAGLAYNTFPKMGDTWIAQKAFTMNSFLKDIVENTATIQFIHRTLGWIILSLSMGLLVKGARVKNKTQSRSLKILGAVVLAQFTLGVLTLLYMVPLSFASMHQAGAVILLIVTLKSLHCFSPKLAS